jgi:hypothetical protein
MVDEAAKAAGYTIGPVYHGTQSVKRFYKFAGTWNYRFAAEKGTTYFTNNKDVAAGYGVRVVDAYLRMINPLEVDAKGQHWTITSPSALVKAKRDGNDGVIIRNVRDVPAGVPDQVADVYVTFNPSQIKSADPITYDDNGNVIPLSQRFNSRSEDIRNPRQLMGININDSTQDFTGQILRGEKTIETRSTRSLDPYIGKRVGIVRTGVGKATLVGYATVGEPIFYDSVAKFRRDQSKHRVAPGSAFDIKDRLRYGYPLMKVEVIAPKEVQSKGIVARKLNPAKRNPVVFPADDITFAAASPTPANLAIAAGKTLWDTPAFKKWFGDSKVRDLAKRPMVVYHGTCSAEFTEFDPTKTQEVGFHFGTPAQAKDFLKGCGSSRGKTPGIYPVYLSIQNPIFTPDVYSEDPVYLIEWLEKTNHIHEWFPDESDSYYRSMNRLRDQMASLKSDSTLSGKEQYEMLKPLRKATTGLLRKVIMRKGYDGIRYKNENEGRTDDPTNIAWIAFSPAQVKSATENIRTFDRRDPDIRNPRRSMIRTKLSRILEPGDRVLDYDRAQGEDLYRLWDMVHTDKPLTKEALVEIEGMLDDDGVLVIQSGEEPSGLKDHFRRATRYQGMLLVQGPMNPEEARINTEKLRRDLE